MTVKPVWMALVLAAAVAGCEKNTGATYNPLPPLANLRYFDAVPDTGFMDFRVVDIVSWAPNATRAIFRSGGNPYGTSTNQQTPYLPVQTGQHEIKVFLDSTDVTTASTVLYDTTMTFNAGWNYTFILYGSARAGGTALHSYVLADSAQALPTDTNSTVWVRAVNLAADTFGLGTSVDAFVTAAAAPAAPATFTPILAGAPSTTAYRRVTIGALKTYLTRTVDTTLTPTVTATLPAGSVGTSTTNPIAGALVKNTAVSAVILPRVIPDSISSLTSVRTTVTPPPPASAYTVDTFFATTVQPHHLSTGMAVRIYGATPAAYNATLSVIVTGANTFKAAFTGTPPATSPATGPFIVYRSTWKDYPNPGVIFLIDQQPPLTAP